MNKFHIRTKQVTCTARKSRFVEPGTGNRVNQFTSDDLLGVNQTGPRLNDGNETTEVMAFEGDRPQDARVTAFGDLHPEDITKRTFDRVLIAARNENFETDRPIYLRVRRRGVVIYCQKLNLNDFNTAEGFVSKQIKLGMTIEDDGQNYDIDLEQDKTRPLKRFPVVVGTIQGTAQTDFLSPADGADEDLDLYVRGSEKQTSSGRFVLAEIKLLGEVKLATELRYDEKSGTVETLENEPYNLSTGDTLRGTLPVGDRSLDRWFERQGRTGEFILKTALIPNVDPFAPDGIVKGNNPQL